MKNLGLIGIYRVLKRSTGELYVGSSYNIHSRWKSHKRHMLSGDKRNPARLIASYQGDIDDYDFAILELCSLDVLLEREQYWIDAINPRFNQRLQLLNA